MRHRRKKAAVGRSDTSDGDGSTAPDGSRTAKKWQARTGPRARRTVSFKPSRPPRFPGGISCAISHFRQWPKTPVTPPTPENRILIAVAALVRPGQATRGGRGPEVLIALRHPQAIRGGLWELPGGKASAGESASEAAARELLEETGVDVDPATGRELGTVEQDDPTLPAERWLRLTLVAFEAPPGAVPRPLAAVECRWERITALDRYEWPAANRTLNAFLAAAFR